MIEVVFNVTQKTFYYKSDEVLSGNDVVTDETCLQLTF